MARVRVKDADALRAICKVENYDSMLFEDGTLLLKRDWEDCVGKTMDVIMDYDDMLGIQSKGSSTLYIVPKVSCRYL